MAKPWERYAKPAEAAKPAKPWERYTREQPKLESANLPPVDTGFRTDQTSRGTTTIRPRSDFTPFADYGQVGEFGQEQVVTQRGPVDVVGDRGVGAYAKDRALGAGAGGLNLIGAIAKEGSRDYRIGGFDIPDSVGRVVTQTGQLLGRLGWQKADDVANALIAESGKHEFTADFANSAKTLADRARVAQSPQEKLKNLGMARAFDAGAVEGLSYIANNPERILALAGDSIAYQAVGGALGRAASAAGASVGTGTGVALAGEGGLATIMTMDGARERINAMSDADLSKLPDWRALSTQYGPEQAKEILAERAATIGGATSAALNTLVLGASARLPTVERIAAGGRLGGSAGNRATLAAGAEMGQEFAQGAGDQFAANVGDRAAGLDTDLTRNVASSALQEALAAGPAGAIAGLSAARPQPRIRPPVNTGDPATDAGSNQVIEALNQAEVERANDPRIDALRQEVGRRFREQAAIDSAQSEVIEPVRPSETVRTEQPSDAPAMAPQATEPDLAPLVERRARAELRRRAEGLAPELLPDLTNEIAERWGVDASSLIEQAVNSPETAAFDMPAADPGRPESQPIAPFVEPNVPQEPRQATLFSRRGDESDGLQVEENDQDALEAYQAMQAAERARIESEPAETFAAKAMQVLGQNKGLYRTQLQPGRDIGQMAEGGKAGNIVRSGVTNEDGVKTHTLSVDQGKAGRGEARIMEDKDNVWIDVSGLTSGAEGGEAVYNLAFSLAQNTGKNFMEDPAGLSDKALYRRPVQQQSMLMKAGSAQNIAPGPMLSSPPRAGPAVRPIRYDPQRRLTPTLSEHLQTNYANTVAAIPAAANVGYDLDRDAFFERGPDGKPVRDLSDGDIDGLASAARANPAGPGMVRTSTGGTDRAAAPVGRNSIKNAALISTLLRAPANERSAILDKLGRIASSGSGAVPLGLRKILPSQRGEALGSNETNETAPTKAPSFSGLTPSTARDAASKGWGKRAINKLVNSGVLTFVTAQQARDMGVPVPENPTADNRVAGFYVDGKAYVVSDQVTADEVAGVVLHEVGEHYGMRGMLGDSAYDRLLRFATSRASTDPEVKKAAESVKAAGTPDADVAQETLAYLLEHSPGNGLSTRIMDGMKLFLNRLGISTASLESETELVRRVGRESLRAAARSGTRMFGPDGVVDAEKFSKRSDGDEPDQTDTPEFKRWFGDSVVTDNGKPIRQDGKPLVVYHGTDSDAFTVFDRSKTKSGPSKFGFWFTNQRDFADAFGKRAEAVYLRVERPKNISLEKWNSIRDQHAKDSAWFSEWRDKLIREGFDGLVVTGGADQVGRFSIQNPNVYAVFDPEQIKSATGNTGAFDPKNPDIRFSKRDTIQDAKDAAEQKRQNVRQFTNAGPAMPWTQKVSEWEGSRERMRNLRMNMQDKLIGLRDVQQDITEQGGLIDDVSDAYTLENLMHGKVGNRFDELERSHIAPLVDGMKAAGVDDALLEDYLEAAHAEERNKAVAGKNPDMPDGGSGLSTQDAKDFIGGKTKGQRSGKTLTPELLQKIKPLARRVYAITEQTRKNLLDAGLITQQQYDAMRAAYSAYVPLRGKDGVEVGYKTKGRGIDIRGKNIQRAMGRGEGNRAVNLLAEVIADAQRSIVQSEKSTVSRAVAKLVLENPNPDVWEFEPVETEQRYSESAGEVYQAVKDMTNDPGTLLVPYRGKMYRVNVKSEALQTALKNLNVEQLNVALQAIGGLNRYFSAILTRYNPSFVAINLLRDFGLGFTGIAAEHGVSTAAKALRYYPMAMAGMFLDSGKSRGNSKFQRFAREFAEDGGKTIFHGFNDVSDLADQIGSEFKSFGEQVKSGKGIAGKISKSIIAARREIAKSKTVEAIGRVNDAVENAIRLAAYTALREKGVTRQQAAAYAKNLTVNFNRRGAATSVMNAAYLFFNAAVQGAHRVSKLLRNPKVMATMGALSVTQGMMAAVAMSFKDDDGEDLWSKIPEWQKQRNFVFVIPYKGDDGQWTAKTVLLPMAYGFNIFPYLGGRLTEESIRIADRGDDFKPAKLVSDMGTAVAQSFSPIPIGEGVQGLVPTAISIFDPLQSNRDDLGRTLTNEQPYSKYEIPRASLGKDSTPEPFKMAARALNRLGGGDDYTPPMIMRSLTDRSPEDLKYLLETFTGGIGSTGTKTWNVGEKLLAGMPVSTNDIPILSSLTRDIDEKQSAAELYFDRRDQVERELAKIRDATKAQGDGVDFDAILADGPLSGAVEFKENKDGSISRREGVPQLSPVDGSLYETYKEAEKEIEDIRDEIRAAYSDPALSWTERKRKIDELQKDRTVVQRRFNRAWNDTQGRNAE